MSLSPIVTTLGFVSVITMLSLPGGLVGEGVGAEVGEGVVPAAVL